MGVRSHRLLLAGLVVGDGLLVERLAGAHLLLDPKVGGASRAERIRHGLDTLLRITKIYMQIGLQCTEHNT